MASRITSGSSSAEHMITFTSGLSARNSCRVCSPFMPGINGLQTLQELRALSPDVKVIMCSAEDDPEVIREAIVLGARAYLIKPIQHLYLTAAVERCLTH